MSVNLGDVWFNYQSNNNFPLIDTNNLEDEIMESIHQEYAATILSPIDNVFFWLAFQNVEDHIDGNGLSTILLTKGSGQFYYDGHAVEMKENDIVLFDDNIEHGFVSKEGICLGLNITWGKYIPTIDEVTSKIETCIDLYNKPNKKLKKF